MINHIIKKELIHQKPCDLSCLCCNFLFSTADFAISPDDLYVENNVLILNTDFAISYSFL